MARTMYWGVGQDNPTWGDGRGVSDSLDLASSMGRDPATNRDFGAYSTRVGRGQKVGTTNAPTIRSGATENLATLMSGDPSGGYSDKLQQMLSGEFGPTDPSYQWRFNQGQQAVERSAAARGLLGSGNAAIELQQYGQGAASQEYGAQFSRIAQAMGLEENAFQQSYGQSSQTSASVAMNQLAQRKNEFNTQQETANNTDAAFLQMLQSGGGFGGQRTAAVTAPSNYSSTNAYPGGTAPIDMMSGYSGGYADQSVTGGQSFGNISNSSGDLVAAWGGE
jgi:hypothetical protein